MRLGTALPVVCLVLAPSLAAARPVTVGVGIGSVQAENDWDDTADDTLQVFGRLGLTSRVSGQLELHLLEVALRFVLGAVDERVVGADDGARHGEEDEDGEQHYFTSTAPSNIDAGSLESAIAMEDRNQVLTARSADFREGIAAFLEKREPKFQDR